MINIRQVEVSRSKSGMWQVVLVPKDTRKTSFGLLSYHLKHDARVAARAIAIHAQTELVVKNRRGQIREKDSFGSDPSTVKG